MVRQTPRVRALWNRVRRPAEILHDEALGALWQRARRPVMMFTIGIAMAAPASAFMLKTDGARAREGSDEEVSATGAGVLSGELADARMTVGLSRIYGVPVGLAAEIHSAASAEGITPRLAFGLVRTESEFRRTAKSPVGAIGYTQVMPATAKTLEPGTTRDDLYDGRTNLHLGFKYLKKLIDRYDGDVRLALTAYNRGPGTVDRQLKRGRDPENGYAAKVLADPVTQKLTRALREVSMERAPRVAAKPAKAVARRARSGHAARAHHVRRSHHAVRSPRHAAHSKRPHGATRPTVHHRKHLRRARRRHY